MPEVTNKVCLYFIAHDPDAHSIPRMLDEAKGAFDCVYILNTQPTGRTVDAVARAWSQDNGKPVVCRSFTDWGKDGFSFRIARQKSIEGAWEAFPSAKWFFWLDCDDLLHEDTVRFIREEASRDDIDVSSWAYYVDSVPLMRDRMTRRGYGKWVYNVHEVLAFDPDVRRSERPDIAVIHDPGPSKGPSSRTRNIRLLEKETQDSPRFNNYLATEYAANGEEEKAIDMFESVTRDPRLDFLGKYNSLVTLGLLYAKRGDARQFRDSMFRAIEVDPARAEAYFHLGNWEIGNGHPLKALSFARAACSLPIIPCAGMKQAMLLDASVYQELRHILLYRSLLKCGDKEEARKVYDECVRAGFAAPHIKEDAHKFSTC